MVPGNVYRFISAFSELIVACYFRKKKHDALVFFLQNSLRVLRLRIWKVFIFVLNEFLWVGRKTPIGSL